MLTPDQIYALQGLVTWLARNVDFDVNMGINFAINEDEDTPITCTDAHAALDALIKQTSCISDMQTHA